jgi:hypothetical protein
MGLSQRTSGRPRWGPNPGRERPRGTQVIGPLKLTEADVAACRNELNLAARGSKISPWGTEMGSGVWQARMGFHTVS